MKKFLAIMLAMLCICTMGVAATGDVDGTSAADTSDTADVLYAVNEGYTWSIHADIDFGEDAGVNSYVERLVDENNDDAIISVSRNIIAHGKKLQISIASANGFKVKTAANDELSYEVRKNNASGAALAANDSVLEVAAGTNTGSQALYFKLTTSAAAAEVAGNYSDTLTYTAAIVDQA
ncbi:MAG: hypothetical protein IJI66_08775 [Erysipelotrichaceae bacterium]|nr:hypothetical protein [Erysipelotrichaceae bacterium]